MNRTILYSTLLMLAVPGVVSAAQSPNSVPDRIDPSSIAGPPEWIDFAPDPLAPADVAATADDWLNDPFNHLADRMGEVVDELEVKITENPVPDQQARIVSDLDTLIELLEKACSGGGSGSSGANPTRPAADSAILGGPGGQGELTAPKNARHEWADLPPNERKEILQSDTEGFPPGYQDVVEDYFNRLAVEKPVSETPEETE